MVGIQYCESPECMHKNAALAIWNFDRPTLTRHFTNDYNTSNGACAKTWMYG